MLKATLKKKVTGRRYAGSKTPDHKRSRYRTPDWLFNYLNLEYGPFGIDVAACAKSAKCEQYYSIRNSGLDNPWVGSVFCNPPYNKILPWVEKAIAECDQEYEECKTAVLVLPMDMSSLSWGFKAVKNAAEIIHVISDGVSPGRVSFIDADTGEEVTNNNKGTTIFVFSSDIRKERFQQTMYLSRKDMEDYLK